jgi:hypothetical protein
MRLTEPYAAVRASGPGVAPYIGNDREYRGPINPTPEASP